MSEQEFVDCVISELDYDDDGNGCNGGWEYWAFEYAKKRYQSGRGDTIVYKSEYSTCLPVYKYKDDEKLNALSKAGVYVDSYFGDDAENRAPDADHLLQQILSVRVASVGIYVNDDLFNYVSGIYNGRSCQRSANHAVAAVGYSS